MDRFSGQTRNPQNLPTQNFVHDAMAIRPAIIKLSHHTMLGVSIDWVKFQRWMRKIWYYDADKSVSSYVICSLPVTWPAMSMQFDKFGFIR